MRPLLTVALLSILVPCTHAAKRALLIGINNYKYPAAVSPLAGSLNDVEDMRAVLTGKFEFPPDNILVLKDAEATHAGIVAAIQKHLIAASQKDDIVVFHYSGHGSQMKDVTGKMISGLDETIVPYDSRDPAGKVFDISGAELHGLLLQLAAKTANVTFILDSCHSGTMVREVTARTRGIPEDLRPPPDRVPEYAVPGSRGLGSVADGQTLRYAFIAATTSRESAFEHFADGKEHGALSYFLTRQLRSAGAGVTYRDIMDNVTGNVSANYPAQHPQLEGAEADQFVFGDRTSLARTYVAASPVDARRVSLAAGQVQGVTAGSLFAIYKPGAKMLGPPEKPLATAKVTAVQPYTAEATLTSAAKIPAFSRAVETEHRFGASRIRVYLDSAPESTGLQKVREALAAVSYIELAPAPSWIHLQVRESGGKFLTLGADSTTLSTPVSTKSDDAVDRVVGQIKAWARWFGVLSLQNSSPESPVQFTVQGNVTRDPLARIGKPDAGVWDGENIQATIKNLSAKDLYVTILDLSSDGSIAVIYPADAGSAAVLKPGLSVTRAFKTFVPPGRSTVTDVLKVFCLPRPVDFRLLVRGAIRDADGETDPLDDLLTTAFGTRQVLPVGEKPIAVADWTTAQRVLVVKRKR